MVRPRWTCLPAGSVLGMDSTLRVPDGYARASLPADPPEGAREAWLHAGKGVLVITGDPPYTGDDRADFEMHDCDAMGCGYDHVLEVRAVS